VGSLLGSKASLTKRRTREDCGERWLVMGGLVGSAHGTYLSYGCFAEEDELDAAAGLGRVGRW
jgi:hypothetical protein